MAKKRAGGVHMKTKTVGFYLERMNMPTHKRNNEELFMKLENANTDNERHHIIEDILMNNIRLVFHILHKRFPDVTSLCQRIRVTYDDIFSVGVYGLLKAVYTFDGSKKIKFATYASRVINNELGMFIRKHRRSIMVMSIEETVHEDKHGRDDITLMDILVDSVNDIEQYTTDEYNMFFLEELEKALTPREINILRLYFYGEMTQRQIADALGISQSYASRKLKSILQKAKRLHRKLQDM
jgi:RNA polymerase sporulation-specific sigma factor